MVAYRVRFDPNRNKLRPDGTVGVCGESGNHVTKLEKKHDIEDDGNSEDGKGDVRENVHLGAYGFEVFEQFLLFEGISVSGFAD